MMRRAVGGLVALAVVVVASVGSATPPVLHPGAPLLQTITIACPSSPGPASYVSADAGGAVTVGTLVVSATWNVNVPAMPAVGPGGLNAITVVPLVTSTGLQ